MTTPPPTPEAVEAAMRYATFKEYSAADFAALNACENDPCEPTIGTAARILAAEVERLRADLEKARNDRNRAGAEARKEMMAEGRELRDALAWLEEECPAISHDAWTNSVDMSGDRWTLVFRIDGKRERIRGRTLVEAINKARAAQAKHKEGQG